MRLHPLGDQAIIVELGDSIDEATHRRVRAACARLERCHLPGVIEYVPAFASVTAHYDPVHAGSYDHLATRLAAALADLGEEPLPPPRRVEIPVCYGDDLGPDLEDVARRHGLTAEDVIAIHSEAEYLVYMMGFAPGFAYLGGLPERIATPRRAAPRTAVPAGSVGIGGAQTGVYPITSPGGWQLIGRTPRRLFTPERDPSTLLRLGDRVRFRPIAHDAFASLDESQPVERRA